ncbi:sulfotransferase [Acuticoccus yangtzensis]|uniref:sulfotransferase n=1 Tax=Acuticoccus yangtzensis TaxID=1443441 RepID=UPI0009495BD4|nr:sulfotransferase [Acuticoccus yangtzensis]
MDSRSRPIFVLGVPSTAMAVASAMIGANPGVFGVPDLNIFAEDRLETAFSEMQRLGPAHADGLLRTVALLYAGDQSIEALQMAKRWVFRRYFWPSEMVFAELCARVAPRRLVDRSRVYGVRAAAVERIRAAYPEADFVHLVSHPLRAAQNPFARRPKRDDPPPVPGAAWAEGNAAILASLKDVAPAHVATVRLEDIAATPETALAEVSARLGLRADGAAVAAMMRPEDGPFARPGPAGGAFGDDRAFLRDPAAAHRDFTAAMTAPLPDEAVTPDVADLAARFGYTVRAEAPATPAAPAPTDA